MAGLIALFEANTSPQERDADFQRLLVSTSHFKKLELPKKQAVGRGCTAAKLDAPSSLHRGIIRNPSTGSWLLATGTVVALQGNNDPHGLLEDFLQGYLDQGVKVLDRYDGHFALVIYNGRDGSLSILSDPMGLFAIYYARRGGQVLISTSALAVARMVNPKVDTMTLDCFLRTGRSYGEKTLWQDVKKILPATLIKISSDQFEEREYWTPSVDEHIAHLKLTPALVLADDKISRIFELALAREGKVWADLTGGYDTRVITMYLDKLGIPFSTYCVGPQGHPDVEISKLVSREMGWEYFPYLLPDEWGDEQFQWFDAALGRGDGLLNIFHLTGVLKLAKERSALSFATVPGTGVDEWRYHIFGANTLIASTLSRVNYDTILDAKIMENIPVSVMHQDRTIEARQALTDHLRRSTALYSNSPAITQLDIAFLRYRHPIHSGAYLSGQSGTMRSVIPFCFKELVNFCFSMNHQWRIRYHSLFVSSLMEKENSRLAHIGTEKGGPFIPIRLTNLHKFIPLTIYLADHMLVKLSSKYLGKHISLRKLHHYPNYPKPEWKVAWLRWVVAEGLLKPEKMLSGEFYNPERLAELINLGLVGKQTFNEFLDRVVTIEMALRATGAELEKG